jgi:hypothetical protein
MNHNKAEECCITCVDAVVDEDLRYYCSYDCIPSCSKCESLFHKEDLDEHGVCPDCEGDGEVCITCGGQVDEELRYYCCYECIPTCSKCESLFHEEDLNEHGECPDCEGSDNKPST